MAGRWWMLGVAAVSLILGLKFIRSKLTYLNSTQLSGLKFFLGSGRATVGCASATKRRQPKPAASWVAVALGCAWLAGWASVPYMPIFEHGGEQECHHQRVGGKDAPHGRPVAYHGAVGVVGVAVDHKLCGNHAQRRAKAVGHHHEQALRA